MTRLAEEAAPVALQRLRSHAWLRLSDRSVLDGGDLALAADGTCRWAGMTFPLAALAPDWGDPGDPSRLVLQVDGWRLEELTLFRPMIYLAAFGKPEIFEMLRISIRSIERYGGLAPDYLVISRRSDEAVLERVLGELPADVRARVQRRFIAAETMLDFALARYRMPTLGDFSGFAPIIYLDIDVMCDRPLEPMCVEIARRRNVLALGAGLLAEPRDFFGGALFREDPRALLPETERGFNSGILAAQDFHTFGRACALVRAVAAGWHAQDRPKFALYDQPLANYTLKKAGLVDIQGLRPFINNNGNKRPADVADRRGLVHFLGGVGRVAPKILRMREYEEALARVDAGAA